MNLSFYYGLTTEAETFIWLPQRTLFTCVDPHSLALPLEMNTYLGCGTRPRKHPFDLHSGRAYFGRSEIVRSYRFKVEVPHPWKPGRLIAKRKGLPAISKRTFFTFNDKNLKFDGALWRNVLHDWRTKSPNGLLHRRYVSHLSLIFDYCLSYLSLTYNWGCFIPKYQFLASLTAQVKFPISCV